MALARLPLEPKPGFRVLSYHSVGGNAFGDHLGLSSISPELFKKHISSLSEYKIVGTNDSDLNPNQLSVGITFDDGYRDNLYIAAPILVANNMPFTIFIATDLVANSANGFLSPHELKELSKLPNVTIGAHGKTHAHLTKLTDAQIITELKDSKSYLEDLLNINVDSMSYPYGDTDQRVVSTAKALGYKKAFTSRFALNNRQTDSLLLNRCAIMNIDSTRALAQKINGDWDWYGHLKNY